MKRRSFLKGTLLPFMPIPNWVKPPSSKVKKHYLGFIMYGAPARWGFDMPLAMHAGEGVTANPLVINERDEQGNWRLGTTDYNNYRIPSFWSQQIPTSGGGVARPLDILENTHIARGVYTRFAGHPIAAKTLVARSPGGASFTGLLADASPYLFNSLALGDNPIARSFVSPLGQEGLMINQNPEEIMSYLLQPFQRGLFDLDADEDLDSLFALFGVVFSRQLNNKKIAEILAHFKDAYQRYNSLAAKAMCETTYKGINDRPIESKIIMSVEGKRPLDYAAMDFWVNDAYYAGPDLRYVFRKARLDRWPGYFAFAETVVKYELSNNVVLAPQSECGRSIINLEFINPTLLKSSHFANGKTHFTYKQEPKRDGYMEMDSHIHGRITTAYANALMYAGFSTCLVELVSNLKKMKHSENTSAFDQTLIHYTAEFGREPLPDGPKTNHDPGSHVSTFISGMIPKFHVSGNLRPLSETSQATHGQGGKEGLEYGHVMATIAKFMGIRSLIPSGIPLVKLEGNKYVPTLPMGRIVA
jgi:hypothetical protein